MKGDLEGIMRGQCFLHVNVLPTPNKFFLPCDVMYAISEPRPSAILSHRGQMWCVKIAEKRAWEEG